MDWIVYSPNSYVEVLTSGYLDCDCIWRQDLSKGDSIKWGLGVDAYPLWLLSLEEEEFWIHRGTGAACVHGGTATWGQGGGAICKQEESNEDTSPAKTSILGFKPPELKDMKGLLFQLPSLLLKGWTNPSSGEPEQTNMLTENWAVSTVSLIKDQNWKVAKTQKPIDNLPTLSSQKARMKIFTQGSFAVPKGY